jgi:hypothetical protein
MKHTGTSVEVDRLSFTTDYISVHVELQGGSPVREWVTTAKKVVVKHSDNVYKVKARHGSFLLTTQKVGGNYTQALCMY